MVRVPLGVFGGGVWGLVQGDGGGGFPAKNKRKWEGGGEGWGRGVGLAGEGGREELKGTN